MDRRAKFKLMREFGLCEVLSQSEPLAIGTLPDGQMALLFLSFYEDKKQIPFRLIVDGIPKNARTIRESKLSNIRLLTAGERAEWLRISLEVRAEWKAREAAEQEKELASV